MLKIIIPCLFVLFSFLDFSEANFFVSTTTSSTTLSTALICYDQSAVATFVVACSKKKKRRDLSISTNSEDGAAIDVTPSKVENVAAEKALEDLTELDPSETSERDRREFLHYWLTITKTTALTSYTTTSSMSALFCTPYDFLYGPCAGAGTGPGKKKKRDIREEEIIPNGN